MKKGGFEWIKAAQRAFGSIKERQCLAPILGLSNFELHLEVECDASGVRIGTVLTQFKVHLAILVKLDGSRLNYFTHNKDFYAIVRL